MHRRIVECVPNFSEGRNSRIVNEIESAIARGHGIAVLGRTMDPDHNRSVITFAGAPEAVVGAAVRAVAKAAELIDLTRHSGVHPRLGAADVVPFVPVEGITLEECADLAHEAGERIAATTGIPVYLYEAAARRPERLRLEDVRRGEFEGIREAVLTDESRRPDIGGPTLHPTAGAVIVGARKFLVAYNINLDTTDLTVAKRIARNIRASSGGFPYVKALGLPLGSRNQVQVSMNLTDFEQTPVHVVYEAVRREAASLSVDIAGSEIIGLIPRAVLERAAESGLRIENFQPSLVLERRIEEALPFGIDDVLENLADPARATGGGSAAAMAAAMAASLGSLVARLMREPTQAWEQHREFFAAGVEGDAEAFAALMRTRAPAGDALLEAVLVPLEIAERAALLLEDLVTLCDRCPSRFSSDAITARGLARAALDGAASTAALNLEALETHPSYSDLTQRLRSLR